MKPFISFFLIISCCIIGYAQSAEDYFVGSANQYVNSKSKEALQIIEDGLQKYPDNPKLKALKQKIEEEKEQNQGDSNSDSDQSDKGSQQEEDKTQNQQKSDQEDGRNKGEQGAGNSDEQARNQQEKNPDEGNPNNGQELQQQRYDQILKALKNQEQNTQRRLMMGDNKAQLGRKQKDW